MTELVATLPACLCGLDTNPVASPRMDIYCPKHDAPDGEPELLPEQVVAMIKESVDCEYSDLVGYKARLGAALVDLKLLLNSRVSQPGEGARINPVNTYPTVIEAVQLLEAAGFGVAGNPNALLAMVKEAIAAAQPSPTPADEEAVLRMISDSLSLDSLEILPARELKVLQDRITTALAEARRAQGTPTTDARAKSVVDHLFTILARDYNIELTNNDASELTETVASALSSTPSEQKEQPKWAT